MSRSQAIATTRAIFASAVLCTACASYALVNYEHDANLARAMHYDSETNGGNEKTANRALAEEYYLKYLQQETDSAQRARVYVQLGVLYNTNYNKKAEEGPDYKKARMYFQKALKEEPKRASRAMIRARLGMATPQQSPEERLTIRIDAYRWLQKVSTSDMKKAWMPVRPDSPYRGSHIRTFKSLLKHVMDSESTNLIAEASHTDDPITSLNLIVKKLPGTAPSERAKHVLEAWREVNIDRVTRETLKSLDDIGRFGNTASHESTGGTVSADRPAVSKQTEELKVYEAINSNTAGRWKLWIACIALVMVVGTTWLIRRRRAKKSDGSRAKRW